jgi:hypothetical protein
MGGIMSPNDGLLKEFPEFLRAAVQKGLLTTKDVQRIEFFRRTRPVDTFGPLCTETRLRFLANRKRKVVPTGSCNECPTIAMALETVEQLMDEVDYPRTYNPFLLYGGCVSGRTCALSALVDSVPTREAVILNTSDLAEEYGRLEKMDERVDLRNWLCTPTLLILEDIHLCWKNKRFQRELVSAIASRIETGSLLVVTSDYPPASWREVEPVLVSLLTMGRTVPVFTGTRQENIAAVRSRFGGIDVDEQAIEYLADQIPHNCKRLWDVVSKLAGVYTETRVPITLEIVNGLLSPPESQHESRVPDPSSNVSTQSPNSAAGHSALKRRKAADYKAMIMAATSEQDQLTALEMALEDKLDQLLDPSSNVAIKPADSALTDTCLKRRKAADYKAMIMAAASEQDQLTALEMALEDKLDQLYASGNNIVSRRTMTQVLALVRCGKLREAIECMNDGCENTAGDSLSDRSSSDNRVS